MDVYRGPTVRLHDEDLLTRRWFSRGSRMARVSTLPMDLSFSPPNHYSVIKFTIQCSTTAPVNRTIHVNLGLTVRGHVIVVRHAARNFMRLTNVPRTERRFIDFIVREYVQLTHSLVILSAVYFEAICYSSSSYTSTPRLANRWVRHVCVLTLFWLIENAYWTYINTVCPHNHSCFVGPSPGAQHCVSF